MKPGDMVTYTQRPDLRGEGMPPYHRLGLILQYQEDHTNPVGRVRPFEVLWLQSQNATWYNENDLEVVNEAR